jgi:O-antigen ligase
MAWTARVDFRALGAFTLGFAPVLYLALRGGGYDQIVYSEVGLAVWWLVLLGALAGILPLGRIGALAWVTAGLLGAFVLWTLIASGWSASAERTIDEVGRVATYLGLFVLSVCVVRRDTIRALVTGMAAAFALVSLLAVLSRLYPGVFPAIEAEAFFPGSAARLSYPLNYANGSGNFLALGLPLLLAVGTRARWLAGQAVIAAALPLAALGVVMTASRGGILTAVVGLVVFYALAPDRLPKIVTGAVAAGGSAILILGFLHRHAVRNALSTPLAITQRHQLALMVVLVCTGVALLEVAIGLVSRYARRPRFLVIGRGRAAQLALVGLVVVVVAAVAAGVPGKLSHQWNVFKQTDVTGVASGNAFTRLGTVAGSHRYQYWQTAVKGFDSKPVTGIGPGTFEFYWEQHGPIYEFIRNAHSLYLETLAEAGLIGLALIGSFLLVLLGAGVARSLRAPPLARLSLAAATATVAAFCASAGYDWMWQLACAPAAALLLGGAIASSCSPAAGSGWRPRWLTTGVLSGRRPEWVTLSGRRPRSLLSGRGWRWVTAGVLSAGAVAALIAVAIPFAMTSAIRSSQAAAGAGHLNAALSDALTAQNLEPYAATPRLQQALVLEQAHEYNAARAPVAEAAVREPSNWRIWLIRSRIDAESGHPRAAVRDYRRAHALDPLEPATAE